MNDYKIPIPAVNFQPPVYLCQRASLPFTLDGRLDKPFWENAAFTDLFQDIEGAHMPTPRFRTRAKMLWDDENLYVGAILEGDEIWGNILERDAVIFHDNDFEIFIDPDSDTQQYYEFEMNVLNTVWDLFLPIAYRDGGSGLTGYDMHGLRSAVHVEGSINNPTADNRSWSVEVVIPFAAITECLPEKRSPRAGEYYRMNFSRVQWTVDVADGKYQKRLSPSTNQPLPEDNWVWAPTGVINIHYPELWAFVFFTDENSPGKVYSIPKDEYRKWELRKLYYAQHIHFQNHNCYTSDFGVLRTILYSSAPNEANRSMKSLPYCVEATPHTFAITCPSADGKDLLVIYQNGKVCRIPQQQ